MEQNEEGEGKMLYLTTQGSRNSPWHILRTVAELIIQAQEHTHAQVI